jgi:hypothetical protein
LNVNCISWLEKRKLLVVFLYLNIESNTTVHDLFDFYVNCQALLARTKTLKLRGSSNALLNRIVDSVTHSLYMTSLHFMHQASLPGVIPPAFSECTLPVNLTTLRFSNCPALTDSVLLALQSKSHRITDFQLTSCANITDTTLHTVLQHVGAQLKSLVLNSCEQLSMASFVSTVSLCPVLESLIYFAYRHTTLNVAHLAERCTHLKSLTLYNVKFSGDILITKHQFAQLLDVSVDLVGCQSGYLELIHFLGACVVLQKLELLNRVVGPKECPLSCLQQKQQTGLTELLRNLTPKLHSLSVSLCVYLTDSHLAALALQCPLLRYLILLTCDQVSDQGLIIIAKQCKRLVFLNISQCNTITTSGVLTLLRLSVSLKSFVGMDCKKVDMNEVVKGNKKGVKMRF